MEKEENEEIKITTSEQNTRTSKDTQIDYNLKEIMKKAEKAEKLSKSEIEKLEKETLESVNFVDKIDEINLDFEKYVIYTDGNEQLVYEDGEFFVVATTDITKKREKKTREQAKNMYLEYFIRYVLNPIIKQRELNEVDKEVENLQLVDKSNVKERAEKVVEPKKIKSKMQEEKTKAEIKVAPKKKEEVEIEIDDI